MKIYHIAYVISILITSCAKVSAQVIKDTTTAGLLPLLRDSTAQVEGIIVKQKPHYYSKMPTVKSDPSKYNMPLVKPDSTIDYKMLTIENDLKTLPDTSLVKFNELMLKHKINVLPDSNRAKLKK